MFYKLERWSDEASNYRVRQPPVFSHFHIPTHHIYIHDLQHITTTMQVPGNPFHTAQSFEMSISAPAGGCINGHQHNEANGGLHGGYGFGHKRKRVGGDMMEEPRHKRCNALESTEFRGKRLSHLSNLHSTVQSVWCVPKTWMCPFLFSFIF